MKKKISEKWKELAAAVVLIAALLAASVAYGAAAGGTLETGTGSSFQTTDSNVNPQTTLAATPLSGTAPLTVVFTALCQDPDGLIASCVLSFGDGTTRILSNIQVPQTVQHTYRQEGNFLVTLAAVDNKGAQDQTPAIVSISAVAFNLEPQTELFATPTDGRSPFEVTFLATCRDADGTISSCELEFGDGERAVLQNIESPQTTTHKYVNSGDVKLVRAAILKAKDDKGAADQTPDVRLINVQAGFDKNPETFLDAFPRRGRTPLLVTFRALCFDADGDVRKCEINFGDGETEELLATEKEQEVTHVYTNTKLDEIKFKAELKATDDEGFSDISPAEVQIIVETDIGKAPNTFLDATPVDGSSPLEVTFTARCTDLEKRVTQCRLDFGDGTAQNLPLNEIANSVKHIYRSDKAERLIATLNAKDHEGLIDLSPASVTILLNQEIAGGEKSTFEFDIDVKNVVETRNVSARKRLYSGLLFGTNELRFNIPDSHVEKIVLEVKDTNNLNDIVISLDSGEIYRDQPEPGVYVIPVDEDFEGLLKIKADSSGLFRFWTANFYDVRATVFYKERVEESNEFSFPLRLSGLQGGRVERWPSGVDIVFNDIQLDSTEISRNIISELNTVRFAAQPNARVQDKAVISFFYG